MTNVPAGPTRCRPGSSRSVAPSFACQLGQPGDVRADVRLFAAVVGDAESAAGVEVPEPDSRLGELAPELRGAGGGFEHRLGVEQLGADMEREPDGLERLFGRRAPERFHRLGPLEAELARGASGREVFVAAAGDIGIQPDRDRCDASK